MGLTPHNETDTAGARIAHARRVAGLTQEELAARLGVSSRSIQAYESDAVVPYRHLQRLAEITGRPSGWFLHGDANADGASTDGSAGARMLALLDRLAAQTERLAEVIERLERRTDGTQNRR